MADRGTRGNNRGSSRGGGGRGGRGQSRGSGGSRGGRGGSRGGRGGGSSAGGGGPVKQIIDLGRLMDKQIKVKFNGGREVYGILKGWDALLNLVLDDTHEYLLEPQNNFKPSHEKTRRTGLVVCRGPMVLLICPMDGTEEIANPFLQQEE